MTLWESSNQEYPGISFPRIPAKNDMAEYEEEGLEGKEAEAALVRHEWEWEAATAMTQSNPSRPDWIPRRKMA